MVLNNYLLIHSSDVEKVEFFVEHKQCHVSVFQVKNETCAVVGFMFHPCYKLTGKRDSVVR